MKLRANEVCPLHHSRFCCGREAKAPNNWDRVGPGVKRNRETGLIRRSPAAMRILLALKVKEQLGICALCHKRFEDAREIVADHREPRGMGGAWRDDSPENIQATHSLCNQEKGSRRIVTVTDGDANLTAKVDTFDLHLLSTRGRKQ